MVSDLGCLFNSVVVASSFVVLKCFGVVWLL